MFSFIRVVVVLVSLHSNRALTKTLRMVMVMTEVMMVTVMMIAVTAVFIKSQAKLGPRVFAVSCIPGPTLM